tara:strand:- start:374 stop:628 length:255 start_codon:yes stop_codon:yes gene_type:complete
MSDKNDGGPAFPMPFGAGTGEQMQIACEEGMTLRDYFAAKAIPAIIETCKGDTISDMSAIDDYFAHRAYLIADAMLKQRSKDDE